MILMMTLGLDIFLRATSMAIWGGTARPMQIGISDEPLFLGPLLLNRAYVVGAAVALALFGLFVLFFRTRRGVVLRAISDDYTASWSVGISVERGVALSWAMSPMVATTAGVLWGSVQGVDQSLVAAAAQGRHGRGARRPGQHRRRDARRHLLGVVEGVASGCLDPMLGGGSRDLVVARDADPDHHDPAARPVRPPRHRESCERMLFRQAGIRHTDYAADRALFPIPADRCDDRHAAGARAGAPLYVAARCTSAATCCRGWCGPRPRSV